MISRTELAGLSEAELRRSILIPLFRAMGFSGVEELHGPTEFGKDIVMWILGTNGDRDVHAVVVKAGAISGKVEGASGCGGVFIQAMQAFGTGFVDRQGLGQVEVSKVWIVTSGAIRKPAADALRAAFAGANLVGKVRLIDGDELWRMLQEFSPERTAISELLEKSRLFDSLSPNYGIRATIKGGQVQIGIDAKHPNAAEAEPLLLNVQFAFPDTPQGRDTYAALDAHVKRGSPVTIPGEFVKSIDVPDLLQPFFGKQPQAVELTPTNSAKTLDIQLAACDLEGGEFALPGLRLRCKQGGTHEATFEADGPFGFSLGLVLNRESHLGTLQFKNLELPRNARQNLLATKFFAKLSGGGQLIVRDGISGLPFLTLPIAPGQIDAADSTWMEFSEALDLLQRITTTVITLPSEITRRHVMDVIELADHIRVGIWIGGLVEMTMTVKPGGLVPVLEALKRATTQTLTVTQERSFDIFGQRLQLGKVVMIIQSMEPTSDSLLRAAVDDGTKPFLLHLERKGEAGNLKLAYLKFLPPVQRLELATMLPGLDLEMDEPQLKGAARGNV